MSDNLNLLIDILKSNQQDYQLVFAIRDAEEYLIDEIRHKKLNVYWKSERFFLVNMTEEPLLWIQWSCCDFEFVIAKSIKQFTSELKKYPHWWSNFTFNFHRRQALIAEGLIRKAPSQRVNFPLDHAKFHQHKTGAFWTLVEPDLLLLAKQASTWRYLGEMEFEENKQQPPSRAYLKLWEALLSIPVWPKASDIVLDLGSSPGGWSWVLSHLSHQVISIDKAQLAPQIAKNPHIKFVQESIFAMDPKKWLHAHWVFCDVICYPEKILELIQNWLSNGYKGNMVFTIKFQGDTDFRVIDELKKIPNSRLQHLYHNKHELTWSCLQNFS